MSQSYKPEMNQPRNFQSRNGGHKPFLRNIAQFTSALLTQLLRILLTPNPNMRVKEVPHCTSQSFSISEWTMSPLISIQPFNAPRRTRFFGFTTGSTRAIGSPGRVTKIGSFVFCTFFRSAMHFTLNSEINTVFTSKDYLVKRLGQVYQALRRSFLSGSACASRAGDGAPAIANFAKTRPPRRVLISPLTLLQQFRSQLSTTNYFRY